MGCLKVCGLQPLWAQVAAGSNVELMNLQKRKPQASPGPGPAAGNVFAEALAGTRPSDGLQPPLLPLEGDLLPLRHDSGHRSCSLSCCRCQQACILEGSCSGCAAHLGPCGGPAAPRFLVIAGLIALIARSGASARAAVPIWVAKAAYCRQRHHITLAVLLPCTPSIGVMPHIALCGPEPYTRQVESSCRLCMLLPEMRMHTRRWWCCQTVASHLWYKALSTQQQHASSKSTVVTPAV